MNSLDPRIVKLDLEFDGKIKTFEGMHITAAGAKFAFPIHNQCEIKIANLSRADAAYILSKAQPFFGLRRRKLARVWAGRVSYGAKLIFAGDVVSAKLSQPPDVTLNLKCQTGFFIKGVLVSQAATGVAPLSSIAGTAAGALGLALDWQATDRNVSNYSFTGAGSKQLEDLQAQGDVDVFLDDEKLVIKDKGEPLKNPPQKLSEATGMIGVPEITRFGVRVKYLLDATSRIGARLDIDSSRNPAANGESTIFKLGFELASRDTPFYYIAETFKRGRFFPGAF